MRRPAGWLNVALEVEERIGVGFCPGTVLPIASPLALFTETASGSWIDLATARILKIEFPTEWTWTSPLPPQPGLAGLKLHVQNYTLPADQFPAATSNALSLVLGF